VIFMTKRGFDDTGPAMPAGRSLTHAKAEVPFCTARPRRKRKQVRVADDSPRPKSIDTIVAVPDPRPESRTRAYSRAMLHPSVTAATTVHEVMKRQLGAVPDFAVGGLIEELAAQCTEVSQGNLERPEALLMAQSTTLDAIFQNLTQQAYKHMGQLDVVERLLRLAFRAQSQSRATVETLGNMKNPPTVFARQANLTTGPQQVNNGIALAPARQPNRRNELLERADGKRLELSASSSPGSRNSRVAALAKIDGSKDG
jgi:hypothetical protein